MCPFQSILATCEKHFNNRDTFLSHHIIPHRHSVLSLTLRQGNVVILITSFYSATGKSTSCRSPCMAFLSPSGGVFRLVLLHLANFCCALFARLQKLECCASTSSLLRLLAQSSVLPFGVMAGYPMQTVMRFSRCNGQNGNKKAVTKQTELHPIC